MGIKRLFSCFAPNISDRDAEWIVARTTYMQTQNLYAKARVLELLEHELDAAFEKLQYKHVAPEPATVRRLHAANLPVGEAQMAMDLLGKFAAVQHNRKETEKERDQLLKSLDTAEGARRQAEFAKAKAEALATARGEALMQAQANAREAEQHQVQLSEMLRSALTQLGMDITPNKSIIMDRNSVALHNNNELASSIQHLTHLEEVHGVPQRTFVQKDRPSATPVPRHPVHGDQSEVPESPPGFTVYSNDLHGTPVAFLPGTEAEHAQERPGNGVKWRDIKEVAESASQPSEGGASAVNHQLMVPAHRKPQQPRKQTNQLQVSTDQSLLREGVASTPASRSSTPSGSNPSGAGERQWQAHNLARLVVPHLDASQLESLVRIGASLQSPDMMESPLLEYENALPWVDPKSSQLQQKQQQRVHPATGSIQNQKPHQSHHYPQPPGGTWISPSAARGSARQGGVPARGDLISPQAHVKVVVKNTDFQNFFNPFSAGINNQPQQQGSAAPSSSSEGRRPTKQPAPSANSGNNNNNNHSAKEVQAGRAVQPRKVAPKPGQAQVGPKQSTFSLAQLTGGQPAAALQSNNAVSKDQHHEGGHHMKEGDVVESENDVPSEQVARQRRAAERLIARISERLPPEYRQEAHKTALKERVSIGNQTRHALHETN